MVGEGEMKGGGIHLEGKEGRCWSENESKSQLSVSHIYRTASFCARQ